MGHPVVPEQIRAEWAAWQLELEAICDKIGAAANRLQTRHKRDLDKALAELEEYKAREANPLSASPAAAGSYSPVKRALNRRVLASRGVNIPNGGSPHVDGAETE